MKLVWSALCYLVAIASMYSLAWLSHFRKAEWWTPCTCALLMSVVIGMCALGGFLAATHFRNRAKQ